MEARGPRALSPQAGVKFLLTLGVTQHLQQKQGRWFLVSESTVRGKQPGQRAAPRIALFPPPRPRVKARVPGAEPTTQQAHQWEQNQQITASDLSKWVLRPSVNDEWLPQRQPCHISSPGGSKRLPQCCRELGWQGGAWAPSRPLARGSELGAGWQTLRG